MLLAVAACLALAAPDQVLVVLPVDGANVLPAVKAGIDTVLRATLATEAGDVLQARQDTEAVLDDAVGAGLACSSQSVGCVVRIGLIAGATTVLVPTVRSGDPLSLVVMRVDVQRAVAVAVAAATVDLQAPASIGRVATTIWHIPATVLIDTTDVVGVASVDDAVVGDLPLAAPIAVAVGAHSFAIIDARGTVIERRALTVAAGFQRVELAQREARRAGNDDHTPAKGGTARVLGGVTAGVGGGMAVLAGLTALAIETGLSTPQPGVDPDVEAARALGVVALAVAAVGVVTVGVGAAMFMSGNDE